MNTPIVPAAQASLRNAKHALDDAHGAILAQVASIGDPDVLDQLCEAAAQLRSMSDTIFGLLEHDDEPPKMGLDKEPRTYAEFLDTNPLKFV